jgi:two-component system cell cycle sensor histidine kinase/response regulator CckA
MEAKKIKPGIPVILCTGYSKKISHEKAAAMGINALLMKPVAVSEMAETIRKILEEKPF